MSATEQTPATAGTQASTAFAHELQLRVAEATAALQAAEAMQDPLLAQIADSDLADLRALAAKNDVELG